MRWTKKVNIEGYPTWITPEVLCPLFRSVNAADLSRLRSTSLAMLGLDKEQD